MSNKPTVDQLIDGHWAYAKGIIDNMLALTEQSFRDGMRHGYNHGLRDASGDNARIYYLDDVVLKAAAKKEITCAVCKGVGGKVGEHNKWIECETCDGSGKILTQG